MPQVGNKKFPYTPSGIKQAQKAYERKRNPVAAAMNRGNLRSRLTGAMDRLNAQSKLRGARSRMENERLVGQLNARVNPQVNQLRNKAATDARLNERAAQLDPPNQRAAAPTQPNRRQAIAASMDKVYRPDRDGPKRVAQTLPRPRPGGPSVRPIKRDPQFGRPAGPVGRPAQRPGKPGRRPMRGALAPRPWRPKPPNRRYL